MTQLLSLLSMLSKLDKVAAVEKEEVAVVELLCKLVLAAQ